MLLQAALLLSSAPFAAVNLSTLSPGKVKAAYKSLRDKVYYGDILPPVGSQQISYARFMDLLHDKRIKRIILLSDGKIAMVEVPVEGYASKLEEARYDRKDEECVSMLPMRPVFVLLNSNCDSPLPLPCIAQCCGGTGCSADC